MTRQHSSDDPADEALEQSDVRFQFLLEAAPDAIVLVDEERAVQLVDRRVDEMFEPTFSPPLPGPPQERLRRATDAPVITMLKRSSPSPNSRRCVGSP